MGKRYDVEEEPDDEAMEEDEEDDDEDEEEYDEDDEEKTNRIKRSKELGISCMLNTEVGAVLAVIRRRNDSSSQYYHQDDALDSAITSSLKSLRSLIFSNQQPWKQIDPSIYVSPFLDVISSDGVPAGATAVALFSVLKIMRLNMFDKKTPGAREVMANVVMAVTGCRLEKTHPVTEGAVMMKILQVLQSVMRHPASVLLNDHAVCTVVNTCFQVVQQSAHQGDLLQRTARHTMHDIIHIVFSRLPEIEVEDWENSESDTEDSIDESGYGIRCAVDIFHFLCSLLNVVGIAETEGSPALTADEDVQVFALVIINSALELSGDSIGKHKKLLTMVQDDLFHHLIHYGTASSSPLVLSMICSTVWNIYYFHRQSIRLQLEAFFQFVLFKTLNIHGYSNSLQELALEGVINFCRQPTFLIEVYINYDCDPLSYNVFEDIGKNLCKHAFLCGGSAPGGTVTATSLQLQAFEGLMVLIHNMADNVDKQNYSSPKGPYPVEISEYKPFWEEISKEDTGYEEWIEAVRVRKVQKRKLMIAASHFNRDEKKGMEYLKISKLISDPPDPKGHAMFLRYTPGLDKTKIGDFLGDPSEFNLKVLKEFTDTFELSGLVLDTALRTYLETFRLPGESQKIHRILEAFSERFFEQQSSEIFVTKDAVFILCYSVIMLNTDQHNPQVKKKMTEDEFIRNNRAINNGQDLPREILSDIFQSISTKAITIFGQNGAAVEMNPSHWIQLINKSKLILPYITTDFDSRIGRDMFAAIAGPTVATLSAIFEHTEDEEIIHECIEGLFAVARICQYGLQDALDELLSSFCKFTTLLNPYASAEETLFSFGHDLKPRMATLAVFTVANNFKDSIRGGWRNIIDCLLKLKRLQLLPQTIIESSGSGKHKRSESESVHDLTGRINTSNLMAIISHCLSMENVEESLNLGITEFEQNLKVIQQCKIGSIFSKSSTLPVEPLLNLGRSLIFAAAGKGQKFNTPAEEEETVQFCWELIQAMASCNVHRLAVFWPTYNDYLLNVIQFQLVSPMPFAEKAIVALIQISLKLLASSANEKLAEEQVFKSINLMWKLDGKVLEICNEFIIKSVTKMLNKYAANLLSQLGWKTVFHLLTSTGRHAETYERRVEALINLMAKGTGISVMNYAYCIDCAFRFVALRNSPVDKNMRLMDLMADSVKLIVEWMKNGYPDVGSGASMNSMAGGMSTVDENNMHSTLSMNLFLKLGEVLRKTSLARREEVRNYAVTSLHKGFINAEELCFAPNNVINCFNLVVFAMVDDLHEKMLEYSTRENAERETRSMEGTLGLAMEFLVDVYTRFLSVLMESAGFKTFWLGILRRMDSCMKAELGVYGESKMKELVPRLLTKMITLMQEKKVLVPHEGNDLWEITFIQIQWIAPWLKDELFPDSAVA
ncbi:putative Sec7 domain, guanine nucleotide exchange factor, Sec7 domain superfamily [Helianthus annuus]|uniref:Putative GNOM-like 2 n=1 Tax=Helianthus annuus TaxID=4232 RepID=A0A251SZ03_HELAN|nr:ARF guanine-nucleotide exchange factor GNL2 [Helianthus annuus]KAF5776303.1 putative Sec7 domain, guanine nucleotide exchange factor, Sec7 domain superfamily [Helianthus annuus]KAJ0488051.1 putative Sec7 domain, guanine nucleotide exchange factor, Sec7 domain superfamily [Helianthus annuus]KAJ0503848.1 putative Sec7 domain, guanine nucleotide exchange factor, Sec7 domain superfamily [Helianthus annuus]KAJ0676892.1 putative Sec7 domain, guanine nucleotide exchange factor, Sec7 domain superfam